MTKKYDYYLQVIWESDSSIEIFPLGEKATEFVKNKDYDGLLDYVYPRLGNIDNHSWWTILDEMPKIHKGRKL